MAVFIEKASWSAVVRSILIWMYKLILMPLRFRKQRYHFLLPMLSCRQAVLDVRSKKIAHVRIRDNSDLLTLRQIYEFVNYDFERLVRLKHVYKHHDDIVKSGKTPLIIDCGANIGLSARYFSDNLPSAHLVCVEPSENNILMARLNNISRSIDYLTAAIGSVDSKCDLVDPVLGHNSYRIFIAQHGSIPVLSVGEILHRYPSCDYSPLIIKIDIEGSEVDLFSQNYDWIDLFPVVIIELHDWLFPGSRVSKNFLQAVSKLDRDFIVWGENVFSISNRLFSVIG